VAHHGAGHQERIHREALPLKGLDAALDVAIQAASGNAGAVGSVRCWIGSWSAALLSPLNKFKLRSWQPRTPTTRSRSKRV
jgi:hypothetical protein